MTRPWGAFDGAEAGTRRTLRVRDDRGAEPHARRAPRGTRGRARVWLEKRFDGESLRLPSQAARRALRTAVEQGIRGGALRASRTPSAGARVGGAAGVRRRAKGARAAPASAKRQQRRADLLSMRRGTVASLWADPCRVLLSPASGSSDCWTARSTGQLVRRPERASRAPLGVSSAAAPRSAQSASEMPTLIAEETKRADLTQLRGARPSLRVRRTHAPPARRPRSRRTRRARQASRRRVAAGAIGLFYARFTTYASRRLFGGAGGVGE